MSFFPASLGEWIGWMETSTPALVFFKITVLMILAWAGHATLRRANPQWRVLLWRVAATGTILLLGLSWVVALGCMQVAGATLSDQAPQPPRGTPTSPSAATGKSAP